MTNSSNIPRIPREFIYSFVIIPFPSTGILFLDVKQDDNKMFQVDENGMKTKLRLNYLGMRGMFPEFIESLTSLTLLDVSINQLTQLPFTIYMLTSLTELIVSETPVTNTQEGKDEVRRRFDRAGLYICLISSNLVQFNLFPNLPSLRSITSIVANISPLPLCSSS